MKLHERYQPMTRAKFAVEKRLIEVVQEFDLTYAEVWGILCEIGASWAKGAIREEREESSR